MSDDGPPEEGGEQDWADWYDQVDYAMDDGNCTTRTVVEKLIQLGFTITPPPVPRYAVLYHGRTVIRTDTREKAEYALRGHQNRKAWEIRDREVTQ